MAAIELDGLRKTFGGTMALKGVDLTVEEGEIFGFLGPNGAGKSTTINIMLDFVRPTSGEASVFGLDVTEDTQEIRKRIGVLPEGYDVYNRLSAYQHLEFVIEAKDADDDPDELLDRVGLEQDARTRNAGGYSKGMQQRLVLAMALVGSPDLLILDEPSTGLDPNGARMMRSVVEEENERGATVFFSSHILGQVESVCDTIGILQDGELVAKDSVEAIRSRADAQSKIVVDVSGTASQRTEALDAVRGHDSVFDVEDDGESFVVTIDGEDKLGIVDELRDSPVTVEDFETEEASLDEVFASFTEDDNSAGDGPDGDDEPAKEVTEG